MSIESFSQPIRRADEHAFGLDVISSLLLPCAKGAFSQSCGPRYTVRSVFWLIRIHGHIWRRICLQYRVDFLVVKSWVGQFEPVYEVVFCRNVLDREEVPFIRIVLVDS